MRKQYGVLLVLTSLLLTGCFKTKSNSESQSSSEPEVVEPTVKFNKDVMEAYHYSQSNKIDVDVFYRTDMLINLPHISLKNFYNLLTSKTLTIQKTAPSVYEVTTANHTKAIINTLKDTLDCDDYEDFISTTVYRQEGVSNYYFDGAPFLKVNEVRYDTNPKHKTINFNKYGIDLVGQDDDIILPIVTASNLFTGPTMLTCFCTNEHIYFIDPNDDTYETGAYATSATSQEEILSNFVDGERSLESAIHNYYELCFLIDTYYGLPGREYLHNDLIANRDLDSVLADKNAMTKKAREFLMSENMYEYMAGLEMLNAFLYDAGHSVVSCGVDYILNNNASIRDKVSTKLNNIGFVSSDYAASRNYDSAYRSNLATAYSNAGISNNSYKRYGDTLVYRFNSFMFDLNGWIDHYKKPGLNPIPQDALYKFKLMLDEFESDSSVKNVVIDISYNGGGFGDMVVAMMGLMTGKTYHHVFDTVTENYVTTEFDFDANFDGVFNEQDKNVSYHYNYAILSSAISFSCGNLLPAQAKDNGIMLLGDKSGGGSCAVVDTATTEGLYVRLSCQNHFVTKDNQEVEMGVVPHSYLVEKVGSNYNFSNFYNFSNISTLMNNFYLGA